MSSLRLWARALLWLLVTLLLIACHYHTRTLAQAIAVGLFMFAAFVAMGANLWQALRNAWTGNSRILKSAALLFSAAVYVSIALVLALETALGGVAGESLGIQVGALPSDAVPCLDDFIYQVAEPSSIKTVMKYTGKSDEMIRGEREGLQHPRWGFIPHGLDRSWNKDGVLTWKAQYRYGFLEGPAAKVWPDGSTKSVLVYSREKPGDVCKFFFLDGAPAALVPMRDGKPTPHGRYFAPDGTEITGKDFLQRYGSMFGQ